MALCTTVAAVLWLRPVGRRFLRPCSRQFVRQPKVVLVAPPSQFCYVFLQIQAPAPLPATKNKAIWCKGRHHSLMNCRVRFNS